METLIALAFLASATGIALKMHQSRLSFDRISTQRLTDQLKIENIAEQLSAVDDDQLTDNADRLAKESGVQVDVVPFESGPKSGLHMIISIESSNGPLVHHVWRFEAQS